MHLIAVKDLKRPKSLRSALQRGRELLLTNNGTPMALLIDLDPADAPENMLLAVRDARSRMALSRIREAARRGGAARLTEAEIAAEIAAARAERGKRK